MTTWTTEDREALEKGLEFYKQLKGDNSSPPHIVDSGDSVKTLADYIEQIKKLQDENAKLKREVENLMDGRC
jgi:cell division protein FtsB